MRIEALGRQAKQTARSVGFDVDDASAVTEELRDLVADLRRRARRIREDAHARASLAAGGGLGGVSLTPAQRSLLMGAGGALNIAGRADAVVKLGRVAGKHVLPRVAAWRAAKASRELLAQPNPRAGVLGRSGPAAAPKLSPGGRSGLEYLRHLQQQADRLGHAARTNQPLTRVGRAIGNSRVLSGAGKALGGLGALAQGAVGGHQLSQGETRDGVASLVGAAGGMALVAGGPVAWGVGGAAVLGSYLYTENDTVRDAVDGAIDTVAGWLGG